MNSYSGNPGDSPKDQVRFLIGDTDPTDWQLTDEEIQFEIDNNPLSVVLAAIACVEALISKYTRKADKTVGDLSISYSQIAKSYQALADRLRRTSSISSGLCPPYAGGISRADKRANRSNTDTVQPAFSIGMDDMLTNTRSTGGDGQGGT